MSAVLIADHQSLRRKKGSTKKADVKFSKKIVDCLGTNLVNYSGIFFVPKV